MQKEKINKKGDILYGDRKWDSDPQQVQTGIPELQDSSAKEEQTGLL